MTAASSPTLTIDARGMRCPWPALRLARAIRQHPDSTIRLLADDPAAPRECRAAAEAANRTFVVEQSDIFHVSQAAAVNILFTDGP